MKEVWLALIPRLALYVLAGFGGIVLTPPILLPLGGTLVTAAFTVFVAAVIANILPIRIFERGRFSDCGLGWSNVSARELLAGIALGAVFAALVVLIPVGIWITRSTPEELGLFPDGADGSGVTEDTSDAAASNGVIAAVGTANRLVCDWRNLNPSNEPK